MTHLRVFEMPENRLLVEISSPYLDSSRVLFVAASFTADVFSEVNANELLQARFQDQILHVFYMDITSLLRVKAYREFRLIGALQETDSINILNNIFDILPYP